MPVQAGNQKMRIFHTVKTPGSRLRGSAGRLAANCCAALACVALVSTNAFAQAWPNRPLRLIVPFPAGSQSDVIARVVGNKLAELVGQQVVVDNRVGASGVIGMELAKNAPADGHTLMVATFATFSLLPALKPRLPYDTDRDFIALSRIASGVFVLAVHPALGANTVGDLVKLAKARPGQLNYGSSGNGSIQHLAGEMLNVQAGIKTMHVPYKGAVIALTDLIAGQIQFIVASPTIVMPHAKTARLKVIATTGAKRDPLLPELPTVAETVPGFEITSWQGMVLPVKTPSVVVNKLYGEIVKALQSPEVRESLTKQGVTAHTESPAEFRAFVKADRERMARVARQVDITLD
jgi:tripartite-type tricarboxylate transporter receptor subunit TctC